MLYTVLNGKHLVATTGPFAKSVLKTQVDNETIWSGWVFEYFNIMQRVGNFTYSILEDNNVTIFNTTSRQWTGQLQLVYTEAADIAVSSFGINSRREQDFYFLNPPLWTSSINFDIITEPFRRWDYGSISDLTNSFVEFGTASWILLCSYFALYCLLSVIWDKLSGGRFGKFQSVVRSLELHIRLFTWKDAQVGDESRSENLQLLISSLLAVFAISLYTSAVSADSALRKQWLVPFIDPKSMAAAKYVFLDWAEAPEWQELLVGVSRVREH